MDLEAGRRLVVVRCCFILQMLGACASDYLPKTQTYSSYTEAIAADPALETWLPGTILRNTSNLRFAMIPDRNEFWVGFDIEDSQWEDIVTEYDMLDPAEVLLPRQVPTRHLAWWPSGLSEESPNLFPYEVYCVSRSFDTRSGAGACTEFLAFDRGASKAWSWSRGR